MKLFGRREKTLNTERFIPLEQAKKYENDPEYSHYIFPSEMTEDGRIVCKPQLIKQVETDTRIKENKVKKSKARWNPSFEQSVIGGGKYKGIDREIAIKHGQQKQYNNWQSAKKYKPEQFMK